MIVMMMIINFLVISSHAGGSGFGSQSMRSSAGSGVGRFSHGHTSSAGSTADWGSGSGNWSPSSAGQALVIVPCSENFNVLLLAVSLVHFAAVGTGSVSTYSLLLVPTLCQRQCFCCCCCCIAAMCAVSSVA